MVCSRYTELRCNVHRTMATASIKFSCSYIFFIVQQPSLNCFRIRLDNALAENNEIIAVGLCLIVLHHVFVGVSVISITFVLKSRTNILCFLGTTCLVRRNVAFVCFDTHLLKCLAKQFIAWLFRQVCSDTHLLKCLAK